MIGIQFLPRHLSGSVLLNFEGTKSKVKLLEPDADSASLTKKHLRNFRKPVREHRLFPLSFLSYHGVASVGGRKLLDDRGSPQGKNVYFLESSSFLGLELAPTTALLMTNTFATEIFQNSQ